MREHSVVMVCLNGAETLGEALESLAAQEADVDWELVYVDNGSTDASRAIVDAFAVANPHIPIRTIDVTDQKWQGARAQHRDPRRPANASCSSTPTTPSGRACSR